MNQQNRKTTRIRRGKIMDKVFNYLGMQEVVVPKNKNKVVYFSDQIWAYLKGDRKSFYRTFYSMIDADYIHFVRRGNSDVLQLTEKGQKLQKDISLDAITFNKQKKWDKKWRIICFDIPENKKMQRREMSMKLRQMGVYKFQHSIYVYPYDCEKNLSEICEFLGIKDFVSVIVATSFWGEEKAKKYFNL